MTAGYRPTQLPSWGTDSQGNYTAQPPPFITCQSCGALIENSTFGESTHSEFHRRAESK